MIRFVDLRGQDVGGRFAFFDTVSDTFIDERGAGPTWSTWQEFEQFYTPLFDAMLIKRLAGLAPDWTRTPEVPETGQEPCILCQLKAHPTDRHEGVSCMTRNDLVSWLAGTP